jgi:adenosine kinase
LPDSTNTPVQTKDLGAIATKIASGPKENASRPRTVIITHGAEATLVATKDSEVKTFPVSKLPEDAIVDTNGAGDAFAGGFCGAFVLGKSVDEAVEVGHRMGQMCVGQGAQRTSASHIRA